MLVLWLLLELTLRFTPPEWLVLRPVLVAVRFPKPYAPFGSNHRIYTDQFIGEAALEGNLPTRERRHPIWFSTDGLGFRLNPYLTADRPPPVLVWRGASFAYGASLSDEETLAAQLTLASGMGVYNAGRFHLDPDGLPELDWVLTQLPARPSAAVYLHLEHTQPGLEPPSTESELAGIDIPDPAQSLRFRYAKRLAITWRRLSPAEILATRFFKTLSNDRFLPNPYAGNVRPMRLPDGTTMLIRRYEIESATDRRTAADIRSTVNFLSWCRDELEARGMKSIFVLMPSRYTVYAPWLSRAGGQEAPASDYFNTLERELASRDVVVVNGLTVFRRGIQDEIATGDLSFYRDDNHWNPKGVRRIAEAVARALERPKAIATTRPESKAPTAP